MQSQDPEGALIFGTHLQKEQRDIGGNPRDLDAHLELD
jgi:hypothetical protein